MYTLPAVLTGSIAPKTKEIEDKQRRNGVPLDPPYSPQQALSMFDVLEDHRQEDQRPVRHRAGRRQQLHAHVRGLRQGTDRHRLQTPLAARIPRWYRRCLWRSNKPCLPVAIVNQYW